MTGGEIVAAGKAVEAIGKSALAEDAKTQDALLRTAEGTPEMEAAARTMAARVAVKERIKLKLYQPLARLLGVSSIYFDDSFAQDMAANMANVPAENIVTPAPNVAIPAIQGLVYTFEESNLKELYLNLLATASDSRRADQAHPAFADIIKQLTPGEARLLNRTLPAHLTPIARVKFQTTRPDKFSILYTHLFPFTDEITGEAKEEPQLPTWIDNWQRLGLVEASYLQQMMRSDDDYEWVQSRPEYARLSGSLEIRNHPDYKAITFDKGTLTTTAFGRQFFRAVS